MYIIFAYFVAFIYFVKLLVDAMDKNIGWLSWGRIPENTRYGSDRNKTGVTSNTDVWGIVIVLFITAPISIPVIGTAVLLIKFFRYLNNRKKSE